MPLQRQLYEQLRALILARTVRPLTSLPSSRLLSGGLGISRNTVVSAYQQLETEGYIETAQGSHTRVADLPTAQVMDDMVASPDPVGALSTRGQLMVCQPLTAGTPRNAPFHPGVPEIRQFPFTVWRQLTNARLQIRDHDQFGYDHFTGHPRLCAAIASYLSASRGVRCAPDQIVVTTGAQAALDLLARVLLDPGDVVWMEEPGYPGAQSAFLAAGARLRPLHVDDGGWRLEPACPNARVIFTSPSCQSPLGLTMRMEQRLRLLELARCTGAWVIEDDDGSEVRFDGFSTPAMQGADASGCVIYVGSFNKTMFPSLRLGFMVMPRPLASRLEHAISITGQFAPLILQVTLTDFIEQGHFARHLRRMRRLYAHRRASIIAACAKDFGGLLRPIRSDAGLHITCPLPPGMDDVAVAAAAERRGLNIGILSRHYSHGAARHGLVLGYGAVDEAAVRAGLATLRQVFASLGYA